MKRFAFLVIFLLSVGSAFSAASQVEFVATVKSVQVESAEAATLTMQLTPTFTIDVAVTSLTEIRGEDDAALTLDDLQAGMILKIEGVFVAGGILAKEIQVFGGVAEFEIKATLDSVDATAKQIVVLGLTIGVTDDTRVRDCEGNDLTLADLVAGQMVKVEGSAEDGLVATSVIACSLTFRAPRIAFEGVIVEVTESGIVVRVEGVDDVPVKITEDTEVRGELEVGAAVRVVGTIGEDLSVTATKVVVTGTLQLAPSKLERLKVGQSHPVAIILHAFYQSDVKLSVVSLDPTVAEVSSSEVVIRAGKITGAFSVNAKAVGETTVEVSMPAELGGAKAVLGVEVVKSTSPGEMEIRWTPSSLSIKQGHTRHAVLVFKAPAAADVDIALALVSGAADVVQFPATLHVKAGARFATASIVAGQKPGTVKIRATAPESAGGQTADLTVEVRAK
jgi:hypothetical protein